MWSYIDKEGLVVFTISITNIDYAVLSTGKPSTKTWIGKYHHPLINEYNDNEILTVLYKKDKGCSDKGYVCFIGPEALQQLSLICEDKVVNKPQLVITGFDTKEQVEMFVKWYEGQSEQDLAATLADKDQVTEPKTLGMDCNLEKTYPLTWNGDVLIMQLEMFYHYY